jgi:hypothetical protein
MSVFVRKGDNLIRKKIKEKLDKNTKTSYTKPKESKYASLLKKIKKKFFNEVCPSPPLWKPLISLVAKEKIIKGLSNYEENRKKALQKVKNVLKQNKKYTYKVILGVKHRKFYRILQNNCAKITFSTTSSQTTIKETPEAPSVKPIK